MKKIEKNTKGITLIALVITIIVLIILAGVAINLTLGKNGLLNRAKEAREKYEIAAAQEYIEMKIDECILEKGKEVTLQEIVDYLAEDSNVTYYVALDEVGLIAGEVEIGTPKEIYVIYNRYQFKVDESQKTEFISIVDVDLEGKVSIEAQVKKHMGKNSDGNYTAEVLLKATGDAEIAKLEIQNPNGTSITLEPDGLTTVGKDMTIEFDKTYKVILTTASGHKYTKKIIEKSEETIMNVEQLASFRDKVNSGLSYTGKTVNLVADINLSTICGQNIGEKEVSWEPIGSTTAFSGTFNGNGHKISGMYINNSKQKQSLFGTANKGKIINLTVEGKITAGKFAGGICGTATNTTFEKCINKVEIVGKAPESNYNGMAGGITGYAYGNSQFKECINMSNITAYSCVGGITGYAHGSNIENCYNIGNIIGTGQYVNGEVDIGGIVGSILGNTINNCYNAGDVSTSTSYTVVGGIVGYYSYSSNTTMNRCVNAGTITRAGTKATSLDSGSGYLGTIIGRKYSGTANNIESITPQVLKNYTQEQLKTKLGEEYTNDIQNEDGTWKYNNGYPILKWQLNSRN